MSSESIHYHHAHHHKHQMQSKKTVWISIGLTLVFALLEFLGGLWSHSLALVSDSFHMFSDVLALGLSAVALYYATKKPTSQYTYGYLRSEALAAFVNGLALIVIALGIVSEGIQRFFQPEPIDFMTMLTIALIGLAVNMVLTWLLMRSLKQEDNLNVRSALWHFLGDLFNSIGVIIAAVLVKLTGIVAFDPLISIVISVVIFLGGYKIVKTAARILMEGTPTRLDSQVVYQALSAHPAVAEVHEFHLWSIAEEQVSISCHVLLKEYESFCSYTVVRELTELLNQQFDIAHVTIQVENPVINPHVMPAH